MKTFLFYSDDNQLLEFLGGTTPSLEHIIEILETQLEARQISIEEACARLQSLNFEEGERDMT